MSARFRKHGKGMHPLYIPKHYYWEVKWAWQRAIHGYDNRDWYSIRDWFTDDLENLLLQMKTRMVSYPVDITFEEWETALDYFYKLVKRFNELKTENFDFSNVIAREAYSKEYQDTKCEIFELFELYFEDLWD